MGLPNENKVCRSSQMMTFDGYVPNPSIALLFRVDYATSWHSSNGPKIKREFAVGFHVCMPGVTNTSGDLF